ncbi:MAG: hypothetical protein ACFFAY_09610, partial [Promethearchaeota archaeon]
NCMIDDDTFEKFFHKLMKDFFEKFGTDPSARIFEYPDSDIPDDFPVEGILHDENEGYPRVERFDFDDYVLLVVQSTTDDSLAEARARGHFLILDFGKGKERILEMPFGIDTERSGVSCRNGVLEITIKKSKTEDYSEVESVLKNE